MTIAEYLENPYGKGSAIGYNKQIVINLSKELETLSDKITYKIYRYRDFVIYHVVIPSTKKDDVSYDVIIEVETRKLHEGATTIDSLEFRCFSNCPSFIFTYAHVFRRYKMLCDWLLNKYNEEVRKNAPETRNRYGVIGVERSLYLAMKFIHLKGLNRISTYTNTGIKLTSRTEIEKNVRTQEEIMEKVRAKVKPTDQDKVPTTQPKKVEAPIPQENTRRRKPKNATPSTKGTKSVQAISKTKKTSTSKTIKSTKKK